MPEEKILIQSDNFKIQELERRISYTLPIVQSIADCWNDMQLGKLENEFLKEAIDFPKEFYEKVCLAHIPDEIHENVGPFQKKKKKTLEGLELPDPTSFYEAVAAFNKVAPTAHGIRLEEFEIVGDQVQIKDKEALFVKHKAKVYAESEPAKQWYELQNKFVSVLDELDGFIKKSGPGVFGYVNLFNGAGLNLKPFFDVITNTEISGKVNHKINFKTMGYDKLNSIKSFEDPNNFHDSF